MSDKNTKNPGRFKRLFGLEKDAEIYDEAGENGRAYDENGDSKESSLASAIFSQPEAPDSVAENADEAEDSVNDIEKEARDFYNNHHAQSVEERVRSIHENAMNSYASESAEKLAEEETTPADDGGEEISEMNEQTENPADVESEVSAESVEPAADEPKNDSEKSFGETKNYDMSQLISVLKGTKGRSSDNDASDEDYDDDDNDIAEDSLDIHDSELYDDVNEYYHDFEYTDRLQGASLFTAFRKSAVISTVSVILSLLTMIVAVWFELGHAAGLP